jgi:hypothetical protein
MKPLIVLDIDNTLVLSQAINFPQTCLPQIEIQPHVWSTPRPFLQPFLDWLFRHCEVGIWTAATASYAEAVVNNFVAILGSGRQLKFVFSAQHTRLAFERYGGHKNLQFLRDCGLTSPSQVAVLIDDHPDAKTTNKNFCFLIESFGPRYGTINPDELCDDKALLWMKQILQTTFSS